MHRLGPLVAWTFFEKRGGRYNGPTVAVLSQWYLRHRYRAGEARSQAIPNIAILFGFFGDLLPAD